MNPKSIKTKFPFFKQNPNCVYLDNAATTQCPESVIKAMNEYSKNKTNVHRGFYSPAAENTKKYKQSREEVADFIGAEADEIIFTSGATESLNNIARMLEPEINESDNIVVTISEHHSNLVPWQQLAEKVGCELRFIKIADDYKLDLSSAESKIDDDTKIVSFSYISNVLGIELPVEKIAALAYEVDAYTVIDSAQAMSTKKIDVKNLGADLLGFSGHKIFGPTGIGVMYINKDLLEKLTPVEFGGGMVKTVTKHDSSWLNYPLKFEAGTPNVSGAIGFGEAIKFVQKIGRSQISKYQKKLNKYLLKRLNQVKGVNILRPKIEHLASGVTSFVIKDIHSHDIAGFLAEKSICVRAGHHCAIPLMDSLEIEGVVRVSVSIYNNKDDIDKLIKNLNLIQQKFK